MGDTRGWGPSTESARAQSSVLGVVMVFAIMIMGASAAVAIGADAIASTQTQLDVERAEDTLTQLDSQAAMVALGNSQTQRVPLASNTRSRYEVSSTDGWMNLSYDDPSGDRVTIHNATLGAVIFESGDTTLAYQGGGVWRSDRGNGSVMISPPEFHYRAATLTLPLITINGDGSLGNRASVTHRKSTQYFPNEAINEDFMNPVAGSQINVTVQSEYYVAWGHFFEQRTDGQAHYDHANETVTTELIIPFDESFSHVAATTQPGGITTNGRSPPSPYDDGINFPTVDGRIEDKISDCKSGSCNDSIADNDPVIDTSGTFFYDTDFDDEDLVVDDPGGNVSFVVDGTFKPEIVEIRNVDSDHSVTVFAREDFTMNGGDVINDVDGEADEFRLLVHSEGDVVTNGNNRFVGLLYAPRTTCDFNGNDDLEGGFICDEMVINGKSTDFQYDSAIEDVTLQLNADDETLITYLHVSENEINVTSG